MKQQLTPRLNRFEPNLLIDGAHELWPEGTSRSIANNTNAYGSVLFNTINTSSGVTLTNSQQSSVPSGTSLSFSNQVSKTAAGTLAAGTLTRIRHIVEGYDISRIYNNQFSVIFWVKSSVAATRSLSIRNGGNTHSYVKQYSINATNTWQLVALNFPALNTCPGTLDRVNGAGLSVAWNIVSGSTFQTSTTNAWVAGNFTQGPGEETTWLTGTTHDFNIAGCMLLPGDWSALSSNTSQYNYVRAGRNWQDEVDKSLRYFEKSYEEGVDPGTSTVIGAFVYTNGTATNTGVTDRFKVVKRAAPTVFYWDAVGNSSKVSFYNSAAARTDNQTLGAPTYDISTKGISWRYSTSLATSVAILQHWVADARF